MNLTNTVFASSAPRPGIADLNLDFSGKIRDPLHNTIAITSAEQILIDTPEFQRLRRILQTAFSQYAFSGATHTRFTHSLGVMHVAGAMFDALVKNQRQTLRKLSAVLGRLSNDLRCTFELREKQQGSLLLTAEALNNLETQPYLAQCLRFAALLHDCGHAPLSHSGERLNPSWEDFEQNLSSLDLSTWLEQHFRSVLRDMKTQTSKGTEKSIRHEVYTLCLVDRIFRSLSSCQHPMISAAMAQDVCAVLDSKIAPAADSPLATSGLRDLLHEIVSGEMDADRMDYLLRDSRECGVVYGIFDLGRIFESLGFYQHPERNSYHLALRKSGVTAFEDYLRARWSMYQQVYFHKTATSCEAQFEHVKRQAQETVGGLHLPVNLDEYLSLDDHNIAQFFKGHTKDLPQKKYLHNLLDDLFLKRKFWKRVYEESIPLNNAHTYPSLCPAIMNYLEKENIPHGLVESATNLTRFSPKGRDSISRNALKVIVKDINNLSFLEPVEEHSSLINRVDEELSIKRIFVGRYRNDLLPIDTDEIKKKISHTILQPRP